ncbi:hypothetical protein HDV01_000720 [Terramyces sp. JEL0728]|nr:hypothetical protein HDV01_000720 [Terramyces sp. JEL0728]
MLIPLLFQLVAADKLASFYPDQEYGLSSYQGSSPLYAQYQNDNEGDGGLGDLYEDYDQDTDTANFPKEIIQPDSFKLATRFSATGTQNYICNNTQWSLASANADLFNQPGQILGKHFFLDTPDQKGGRPTWQTNDASTVTGVVTTKVTVEQSSVPWLVVERTSGASSGLFAQVDVILRVKTVGGIAPQTGCSAGQTVKVNYSSEYWFYSKNGNSALASDMVKLTSSASKLSVGLFAIVALLM